MTIILLVSYSCSENKQTSLERDINFNSNWKFTLGDIENAQNLEFNDNPWATLHLPHDWSIEQGFMPPLPVKADADANVETSANNNNLPSGISAVRVNEFRKTASSTGFVPGGVGWYRKSFTLNEADKNKNIAIEFDGVYTRSKVWVNGHLLGFRPNGYVSFNYDLTPHLHFDKENVIAVRVDHSNYVDSRWYTGSGIYRNVRLVKRNAIHIPTWGVTITTPKITSEEAKVSFDIDLKSTSKQEDAIKVKTQILAPNGELVGETSEELTIKGVSKIDSEISLKNPQLWDLETPHIYRAKIQIISNDNVLDEVVETFGIRTAEFHANKGFLLNGKQVKIKGVNLHHDAGAVGAAVPVDVWRRRLMKLKSIGCNAIRTAHNPYAPEFLDLCDELGLLVDAEFFDEWSQDKDKHTTELGSNDAPESFTDGYSSYFNEWAKQDLQDCIRRDKNHPAIFMWSIGNEIEWTFPYYSQAYKKVNGNVKYYEHIPNYDYEVNKAAFESVKPEVDSLVVIANLLSKWTKEMDTTRPVTVGSVLPVIANVSGYADAVDVLGFNYRAPEYDGAHKEYPDLKILGSENNGTYEEWKAINDRDFVAGIFTWTGIAYMGEAGPFPRKGLNLSFFDFACFKMPRGHFYECLWKDDPKVYVGTAPLSISEYKYDKDKGFTLELRTNWLRRWTWYDIEDSWNYKEGEEIVVQGYTNCEASELFLNGTSFGKQKVNDNKDHVIKWLVPFQAGELKIVGYNDGKKVDEYSLKTAGKLAKLKIESDRGQMNANHSDVAHIVVKLLDEKGVLIPNEDADVQFEIEGEGQLIAVDNGWEYNVQHPKGNVIKTHNGKALGIVQSNYNKGTLKVVVKSGDLVSDQIAITIE
ncbi:glycoside hydrolase family 2 TIM barrel-domain containing protein [Algibacter sp. 2305UL17-15]|uniref:glycoside hydrolase family 2 TIM barrel-domain containing protein n=1 Tax=Algibacter sp. 2305UL17-15 TaxID=3231268 RepID=UPI0034580CA9